MTEPQMQAVFSLYALIKTPLFVGADVTRLPPAALRTYLNKEVIAINQDPQGCVLSLTH
jgi:alpha-galactosidase